MNIFDVVLDTEDLLVLGPVDNVELQVDIGPTGKRGSKYFVGAGNPNTPGVIPETEEIQIGDFFINSSTSSSDYGWLYVRQAGQNNIVSWVKAVQLQPAMYANNFTATFSAGLGSIAILLSDIVSQGAPTNTNKYVAQLTVLNAEPVLLTLQQKRIPSPDFNTLFLDIRAIRYSLNEWIPVNSDLNIGVTISVI
jgi:hypothetical protein